MVRKQSLQNSRRRGVVLVAAMWFMCILVTLGLAFSHAAHLNAQMSQNLKLALEARLAAESGLAFHAYLLQSAVISDSSTGQAILDSVAATLSSRLDGTPNLQGQSVTYDGQTITIPAISFDGRTTFTAEIAIAMDDVLELTVVGHVPAANAPNGVIERCISIEAECDASGGFGYGMYSKGPIAIGQNLDYVGANEPEEASIACAATGMAIAVTSGYIDGDVTYDEDASVSIGATVGGDIRTGEIPPPPEIDGSVYEPFATNIVDSGTDTSSGTFTNIRIRAGTNPEFGNNVIIRGVVYIEAPNRVTFKNNTDIVGVILAEDPGPGVDPDDHYVYFKNNLSVLGLDELPDTPQFAELRELGGSAFLLPGFTLEFKNNFATMSGTVVAQRLVLKNNLDATVYGSIIVLGDGGLTFKNNSTITVNRLKYPGQAPGLVGGPQRLVMRASTYREY